MSSSYYVHVEVEEIIKETDKAFLVRIDGEDAWLPHSQIADWADYEVGAQNVTMSVTRWLAEQEGLL
jgi:hypothetical protein